MKPLTTPALPFAATKAMALPKSLAGKGSAKAAPADIVEDAPRVLSETQAAFKAVEKRAADQMRLATDSEYWVAVCFTTREQKEEFLRATGLIELGDKYLDGREVARRLGTPLAQPSPKIPRATVNARLEALARTR